MKVETLLRSSIESDVNFIYNSWLKSLKQSFDCIDNKIFYDNHKKIIEKILSTATVTVCCNPEDEEQIFGYIVHEKYTDLSLVHYIYVKHTYRKYGFATKLIDSVENNSGLPHIATSHTRMFEIIGPKWGLIFNPYILLRKHYG